MSHSRVARARSCEVTFRGWQRCLVGMVSGRLGSSLVGHAGQPGRGQSGPLDDAVAQTVRVERGNRLKISRAM